MGVVILWTQPFMTIPLLSSLVLAMPMNDNCFEHCSEWLFRSLKYTQPLTTTTVIRERTFLHKCSCVYAHTYTSAVLYPHWFLVWGYSWSRWMILYVVVSKLYGRARKQTRMFELAMLAIFRIPKHNTASYIHTIPRPTRRRCSMSSFERKSYWFQTCYIGAFCFQRAIGTCFKVIIWNQIDFILEYALKHVSKQHQ